MDVLYCVGAPRISTNDASTTPGPRAHVLGFTRALAALGVDCATYVVGDTRRFQPVAAVDEAQLRRGLVLRIVGDALRLGIAGVNKTVVRRRHPATPRVVYERFATYNALGRSYQRRGAFWIVESNGLFFHEASVSRKSLGLPRLARWQELRTYARADLVVVVSQAAAAELASVAPRLGSKVTVLRNGVDPELFGPAGAAPDAPALEAPASAPGDPLEIVFVGQLIEWQSLDLLLAAMARRPAGAAGVRLTVVGDGPDRGALERQAQELGMLESGQVRFLGRRPPVEVAALLPGFHVGYAAHSAAPGSVTYHSPLKLYEYAAAGLSVLAGPSEVADELTGLGVPVHSFSSHDPGTLDAALEAAATVRVDAAARSLLAVKTLKAISWRARVLELSAVLQQRGVSLPLDAA